ncbi:MAG TPA: SPW repeat protein [Steroidobacteraceae bacterium]|nr:SPW repeat protein [Steroidobacteraceae bacterium]
MASSKHREPDPSNRLQSGTSQLTLANALRLLTGLWLMEAPFVYARFDANAAPIWNNLIVGGCVVVLATMRLVFVREARAFRIAHLLLGVWIALSPWIFAYTEDRMYFWNSIGSGALIAVLATWSLVRYRSS